MYGAWHEIAVHRYAIGPQPDQPVHKPSVARLIDRAQDAMREERWTDAAPLLRQAIELEPEAAPMP